MATVTLTAEITARIIGQQCDYNYTTPRFNMHIKVVTSTCTLPSAVKKAQLLTHWLDSVPEFSVFTPTWIVVVCSSESLALQVCWICSRVPLQSLAPGP